MGYFHFENSSIILDQGFLNGPMHHCMQEGISSDGSWSDSSPINTLITSDFLFSCGPQFLTEFKKGKFVKDTILCRA